MENWKNIKGLEDCYQISSMGNVRSIDREINGRNYKGKLIKPLIGYGGYYSVQLRRNIKKHIFYIHRLVADHFLEIKEGKNLINHIDENKFNNHYENLEWVTKSENHIHSNKGAGFLTRKFNDEEIKEIRSLFENGFSIYRISKNYNENSGTISNIINRKTYKEI